MQNQEGAIGRQVRICLAASGGGHLRQLLDLQPLWSQHDYFFVTEDTALGRSLQPEHPVRFVPHYGFGQARQGALGRMLFGALKSFFKSGFLMMRNRPEVLITTGAGAVFFSVVWAWLLGARIVVVESFARFEHPSLFCRMTRPFRHELVVQSAPLAKQFPNAHFFDPLKILERNPEPKESLLFATVGAILPFDRLAAAVEAVAARGAIPERIVLQTGAGGARPDGMEVLESLTFGEIQELLRRAAIVVCHGGTGSIITALREGCQVVAMPRLQRLGEVYDDHQAEITAAFERRGLVLTANDADELEAALKKARARTPVFATTEPRELLEFLAGVVEQASARGARRQRGAR